MANQRTSGNNVPVPKGKLFGPTRAAPYTGPMPDDTMSKTDMQDPLPVNDYSPEREATET